MRMLVTIAFILLLPSAAFGIQINEIMYDPAADDNYAEWIEIWNDGDTVDLTGWRLCGTPLKAGYIQKGQKTFKPIYDNGLVLSAGRYAIITDGMSGSTVLENFTVDENALLIHVDASAICGGLNNNGDTVVLTGPSGVVDNVTYKGVARQNYSIERNSSGWFESKINGGTPGFVNSVVRLEPEKGQQPEEQKQHQPQQTSQPQMEPLIFPPTEQTGDIIVSMTNPPKTVEAGSTLNLKVRLFNNFSTVKVIELFAEDDVYTFVLDPKKAREIEIPFEIEQNISGEYPLKVRVSDGKSNWYADTTITVIEPAREELEQPSSPTGAFALNINFKGISHLFGKFLSKIVTLLSGLKISNIISF